MNLESISVENMSHLAYTFSVRDDEESKPHPTQRYMRAIKLTLLFWVPGRPLDDPDTRDELEQDPEKLPRLVYVRVPKGVAIWRLRNVIRHCEKELSHIFGRAKRANLVLVCDEASDNWEWEEDLPTSQVMYV